MFCENVFYERGKGFLELKIRNIAIKIVGNYSNEESRMPL